MNVTFDDFSPFTHNKRVLIEPDVEKNDMMKVCMDTGYHTYDRSWKVGSDIIELVEQNLPNVILNSKKVIDDNVWYKLLLLTPFVTLIPEYSADDDVYTWSIYPLRDGNPDVDDIVMEVEGDDGAVLYRALNKEEKISFSELNFEQAMNTFQAMCAEVYKKIYETIEDKKEDARE